MYTFRRNCTLVLVLFLSFSPPQSITSLFFLLFVLVVCQLSSMPEDPLFYSCDTFRPVSLSFFSEDFNLSASSLLLKLSSQLFHFLF